MGGEDSNMGAGSQAPPPSKDNTPTDYDNEPPILEELGIDPKEIIKKFVAILTQRGFKEVFFKKFALMRIWRVQSSFFSYSVFVYYL